MARCEHEYLPVIDVLIDYDALADATSREAAAEAFVGTKATGRRACGKCGRYESPTPSKDGA